MGRVSADRSSPTPGVQRRTHDGHRHVQLDCLTMRCLPQLAMSGETDAHQPAAVHTRAQDINITHTRGGIMANAEHLWRLREGIDAWNQWRADHEDESIDLVFADLTRVNLSGASLRGA